MKYHGEFHTYLTERVTKMAIEERREIAQCPEFVAMVKWITEAKALADKKSFEALMNDLMNHLDLSFLFKPIGE